MAKSKTNDIFKQKSNWEEKDIKTNPNTTGFLITGLILPLSGYVLLRPKETKNPRTKMTSHDVSIPRLFITLKRENEKTWIDLKKEKIQHYK